jgi:hypothetical protein
MASWRERRQAIFRCPIVHGARISKALTSDHYVVNLARLLTRNPKLVQDFRAMFPTSKVIKLSKNYRSTGVLVKAAASLISHNQSLGDTSAASGAYTVKSMRLN